MVIQPIYNILFLPDVTYHFKKEFFTENASEQLEVGSELLFAFLRNEDDAEELDADHICPVGISARVEAFGDDDSVQIRTLERVDLSDVEVENGQILADASIRAEVDDYTAEEEKAQFLRLRAALLKFVQGYQWGMWARSFILQRKNMYDLGSALSEYLNISPEEKYAIVETDSRRERCTLIEAAINEFMEVAKVSTEAKEAQKDDQEQLYREAAIKKQISYLQKELDELHPENISDTRKFEKKIEESGMNDEARKEAEKVLNRMKQEKTCPSTQARATALTNRGAGLTRRASHTGSAPLSTSQARVATPQPKPQSRATLVAPVLRLPSRRGSTPQKVLAMTRPQGTEPRA